jgi:isochorismate pyruvate lyase
MSEGKLRGIMKTAEECESIEEIRACIDELDRNIILTLARRSSFVENAAKFKRTADDVKARERVESMISERRSWASENGLGADFIESIFRCITNHFIGNEMEEWSR